MKNILPVLQNLHYYDLVRKYRKNANTLKDLQKQKTHNYAHIRNDARRIEIKELWWKMKFVNLTRRVSWTVDHLTHIHMSIFQLRVNFTKQPVVTCIIKTALNRRKCMQVCHSAVELNFWIQLKSREESPTESAASDYVNLEIRQVF